MGWALNVGYLSALTLASPWLALRAARTGRYRDGWAERLLGHVPQLEPGQTAIWVHGVSLGEMQLLRPLVERLNAAQTKHLVVISTATKTGMQVARKSLPQFKSFYCPLDFTWAIAAALDRLHPTLIVLGELEVWPNLISMATARRIPVVVVNGRLSDRSYRGYRRFSWLLGRAFRQLKLVAAQDQGTADRFLGLGVLPQRVHVSGSLKFDNVISDRQHPEVLRLRRMVGLTNEHRVIVVGSTQDPEEQAAVNAVKGLLEKFPKVKLIVVPRHPERFSEVHRLLEQSQLKVLKRSELGVNAIVPEAWQVLLVDTVGELRWWWGVAELALVGGSFGSRGGQNMLEPAAYGAKVAFGPNTSNFREIVRSLLANDAVWQLPSLDSLPSWIDDQLSHPELGAEKSARAVALIQSHQGAMERTVDLLKPFWESSEQ